MKNKSWLSIEKNTINEKKGLIMIIINYFHLQNLVFSWVWDS